MSESKYGKLIERSIVHARKVHSARYFGAYTPSDGHAHLMAWEDGAPEDVYGVRISLTDNPKAVAAKLAEGIRDKSFTGLYRMTMNNGRVDAALIS